MAFSRRAANSGLLGTGKSLSFGRGADPVRGLEMADSVQGFGEPGVPCVAATGRGSGMSHEP